MFLLGSRIEIQGSGLKKTQDSRLETQEPRATFRPGLIEMKYGEEPLRVVGDTVHYCESGLDLKRTIRYSRKGGRGGGMVCRPLWKGKTIRYRYTRRVVRSGRDGAVWREVVWCDVVWCDVV